MANLQEAELHYVFADNLPAVGHTLPVGPGVRWLRMPLPFALDHINLWLLRDVEDTADGPREGWAIVDCGIDSTATRAAWERIFADELQGLPVLRVICTHMHPDHIGLAHWLTERWNCRLWISATDWNAARVASSAIGDAHSGDAAADFYARQGLTDSAALAKVRARANYYASMVPQVPASHRRLMHGTPAEMAADLRALADMGVVAVDIDIEQPSEAESLARLKSWLERERLTALSGPVYGYFDPPWTPVLHGDTLIVCWDHFTSPFRSRQ